jgi:thiosulfate/3-mercaptopyruvate sulfurtransferase
MEKCPNIRPAFSALKSAGFQNVRVLELRTNLRTDWTAKGYPVEPPVSEL